MANFERPVLGCIDANFCNQILIFQHVSRTTRFTNLRTAPISKFTDFFQNFFKIITKIFNEILQNFEIRAAPNCENLVDLEKMLKNDYLLAKIGADTAENEPSKVALGSLSVVEQQQLFAAQIRFLGEWLDEWPEHLTR